MAMALRTMLDHDAQDGVVEMSFPFVRPRSIRRVQPSDHFQAVSKVYITRLLPLLPPAPSFPPTPLLTIIPPVSGS